MIICNFDVNWARFCPSETDTILIIDTGVLGDVVVYVDLFPLRVLGDVVVYVDLFPLCSPE
jgi:hypothetical protein